MRTILFAFLLHVFSPAVLPENQSPETLVIENRAETAGMSAFLADWDKPLPGVRTLDAANRSVLIRFPDIAEALWARLTEGRTIARAEVVIIYEGYELTPQGYTCRTGLGMKKWQENPPQWHVVAWALRRPWKADAKTGPTFNAFVSGAGYWTRYGAADVNRDRYPTRLGPVELSSVHPEGRIDVTPLLSETLYGENLGERLRRFEACGLLVRKLETHDFRYDEWWSAYEWANPTGGHGLSFKDAKLLITFGPGPSRSGTLPPPLDAHALAKSLTESGAPNRPTAVLPSADELKTMAENHGRHKPDWMPDWQWERVSQLAAMPGDRIGGWSNRLLSGDPTQYGQVVNEILSIPPRFWQGWGVQEDLLLWYLYRDMLPAPVQDNVRAYWDAWLMPDVPTEDFYHAQSRENEEYWQRTRDWRGRKSFFRDGYNYVISTMNFNHTAAMGALLGGHIIGSERAMADGRHGLENLPMRLWAWYDGTTQESIDHYYFAITLSGQKMFADFGPTPLDRLMGQSILAKAVEELVSSYHPGLRHFINTSGRTGIGYLWTMQDGLQHIIHTLSPQGALHDLGNPETFGMPVITNDAPPGRIALQTLPGPWAPEWVTHMVDEKPIPCEITVSDKEWGHFADTPLWKRSYLGTHYGIASVDIGRFGSVPVLIQWRRETKPVQRVQDIGTLLVRCGVNTTRLIATQGGGGLMQGGNTATLQHRNKLLLFSSPLDKLGGADPSQIKSMQTTIGLFTFQASPTWKLLVDGVEIPALPCTARVGQRIVLHDGATYVGMIPLPSTDLGRNAEVLISTDGVEEKIQGGGQAKPALLIQQFFYRSDTPVAQANLPWDRIDRAYGGFAIEVGDVTEYPELKSFVKHLARARIATQWNGTSTTLVVRYASGDDNLEAHFRPEYQVYAEKGLPTDQCFPVREVNGQWPYLPRGIDRDSTLTQQGTTGRLAKGGAVLTCEPGRMAYVQTEPISGTYAGFNPLPDPTLWSLALPGRVTVTADGRLSLLRVMIRPRDRRLWIDYAAREDQQTPDMATAIVIHGMAKPPVVDLNGKPLPRQPIPVKLDRRTAYLIPLSAQDPSDVLPGLEERYRRAQRTLAALSTGSPQVFLHDWYVVGPFAKKDSSMLWKGKSSSYPPEDGVDLAATYTGMDRADGKETEIPVRWKRILSPGQPVLGAGPVNLERYLSPNKSACAFAHTTILSDRTQEVTIYTGSDQSLAVWVNGQKVLDRIIYRAAAPDQDKVRVALRPGVNTVLLRSMNGWEGWRFYFRIGDEYGLPVTEGLTFGLERPQSQRRE